MTATPRPAWQPAPTRPGLGPGRVVALVLGLLLLLAATGLLVGAGGLFWADRTDRTDGYLLSNEEALTGSGYALVSDRIELSTGADWVPLSAALGTVRFEATATAPGSETFIGIAPVSDATGYLGDVQRTVIDDLGIDDPAQRELPGGSPSGAPGDQDFWTAQASGTGTQALTWVPAEGDWMLVVMNADGSAGISVESRIGATFPALDGLAWGLLIAGLVCGVIAGLLLAVAARRPAGPRGPVQQVAWPAQPGPQPAGPQPAGSQPPWAPPAQADRTTAPDGQQSATRTDQP